MLSKTDWKRVSNNDIPVKQVSTGRNVSKPKNFFYIEATEEVGMANALCRNCLAVYALLSTAAAIDPQEKWHALPHYQVEAIGLSRYQIRWATKQLEKAGMVETWQQPGRKKRYRLIRRKL